LGRAKERVLPLSIFLSFIKLKNKIMVSINKNQSPAIMDKGTIRKAVLVLRAVNHKLRQQIIDLLEENEKMTVTSLYIKLRLEQSVTSQHLAILRRAGAVTTEREGKFIFYRVNTERLEEISNYSKSLVA
jgi:ArsR family transcriptional regulator, virulence genes transcriptional regulator